jgi:hypothetical protein
MGIALGGALVWGGGMNIVEVIVCPIFGVDVGKTFGDGPGLVQLETMPKINR